MEYIDLFVWLAPTHVIQEVRLNGKMVSAFGRKAKVTKLNEKQVKVDYGKDVVYFTLDEYVGWVPRRELGPDALAH